MFCSNCGKELPQNAKFCPECGSPVIINKETDEQIQEDKINSQENNIKDIEKTKQQSKKKNKAIGLYIFIGILGVYLFLVFVGFLSEIISSDATSSHEECVNHNNLCIATKDIKYDYTAVKTRTSGYPAYNKEWNNGWASAQKACEAWGGRLPYMEDFVTIVDACAKNKIKLDDPGYYLSNTQINAYRVYAYSHSAGARGYNEKSIYDTAIAIDKSADWLITGNYNTSTVYDWRARCVKDINTETSTHTDKISPQESNSNTFHHEMSGNMKNSNIDVEKQANFRSLIFDDMDGYNSSHRRSIYGVIMYQKEKWENSTNENRDVNLKYINKVKKQYDNYYEQAKYEDNIVKLPKIQIEQKDVSQLDEDVNGIINTINEISNTL